MTKNQIATGAAVVAALGIGTFAGAQLDRDAPSPSTTPAPSPAVSASVALPSQLELLQAEAVERAHAEARQARIRKRLDELREESTRAKRERDVPDLSVNDGGAP